MLSSVNHRLIELKLRESRERVKRSNEMYKSSYGGGKGVPMLAYKQTDPFKSINESRVSGRVIVFLSFSLSHHSIPLQLA